MCKTSLIEHARRDLGIRELPGTPSHPRILRAFDLVPSWLLRDDSKTSWCGIILGLWCWETGRRVPREHYRARRWEEVGTVLTAPLPGCVVVWQNHVGLFEGWKSERIMQILGGNQSNAVTVAEFDRSGPIAFRMVE